MSRRLRRERDFFKTPRFTYTKQPTTAPPLPRPATSSDPPFKEIRTPTVLKTQLLGKYLGHKMATHMS